MVFSSVSIVSEVLDKFYTLWVYKPIINMSSMKIFILSKTLLYTNLAKESTNSAKNVDFSAF